MNARYLALSLAIIIVCASTLGYIYYANTSSTTPSPSQTAPQAELRVFIAASLTSVVENASQAFEEANNCRLVINSGGSNSLYQQITSGSPCDVFMSADFKWTKQLNDASLLYDNNYQNFTTNTIILITPKDNPKNITSLLDLAKPGVKLVLAASSVPAGIYANSTLTKIDKTWGNSSSAQYKGPEWQNFYSNVIANVVSYETNVEDVVSKVALNLGTADAGIAFISDASVQGEKLAYVEIPAEVNTRGTYGIAVINTTNKANLADAFMDFWLSDDGQNQLKEFGFGT